MIEKIIISSDLTRLDKNLKCFHDLRIDKYFNLLSWQIKKASGLPVVKLKSNNKDWKCEDFYQLFGINITNDHDWVKIYDVKDIPKQAIEYYERLIKNSLVIYIEASETIKRIHDILRIPYIDLTVHPIRYLSDNFFGVATNNEAIRRTLSSHKIDYRHFESQAQLVKTQAVQSKLQFKQNSLLIVGQTELDKSLIKGQKLYGLHDFKGELLKIAKDFDHVYFKPHPYRKDNENIIQFLRSIFSVDVINDNIYKVLSNANIKGVTGISSSAIYESRFFEKKRFFLKKAFKFDFEGQPESKETYFSIGTDILNPRFWVEILDVLKIETNKEYIDYNCPAFPNQIRAALNDFWAQTEIDPSARITSKFIEGNKHLSFISQKNSDLNKIVGFKKNLIRKIINVAGKVPFGKNLIEIITYFACIQYLKKNKPDVHCGKNVDFAKVHCITYRPEAPFGGRGGAGAVVSAMKKIVGNEYKNKEIIYSFSEKDGVWHTAKNKYFNKSRFPVIFSQYSDLINLWANLVFVRDLTRKEKAVYITHEYGTAYALGLLGKQYALVLHSQGPRVEEKLKLGEQLSLVARSIISHCEKMAIKKAKTVYFPSKGAENSFFNSKFCKIDRSNVRLGRPLYNTLYVDVEPAEVEEVRSLTGIKFMSVGTCTESKGFDNTINYIGKILSAYQEEISWIWVGKGPLEERVKQIAEELSKKYPNFKFIHFRKIPYNQVQYLLQRADIYIMLHRKSIFDLATLEAMKAGCALILSRLEGNLEFNVCNNVLFADTDKAYINLDEINKLKELNKIAFNKFFSNKNFKEEYEAVIQDLLN